jgi:hypothetical protein
MFTPLCVRYSQNTTVPARSSRSSRGITLLAEIAARRFAGAGVLHCLMDCHARRWRAVVDSRLRQGLCDASAATSAAQGCRWQQCTADMRANMRHGKTGKCNTKRCGMSKAAFPGTCQLQQAAGAWPMPNRQEEYSSTRLERQIDSPARSLKQCHDPATIFANGIYQVRRLHHQLRSTARGLTHQNQVS